MSITRRVNKDKVPPKTTTKRASYEIPGYKANFWYNTWCCAVNCELLKQNVSATFPGGKPEYIAETFCRRNQR